MEVIGNNNKEEPRIAICKEALLYDSEDDNHRGAITAEEEMEMYREKLCGYVDHGAWDAYLKAEKLGIDPNQAIDRWYTGEPQEWESTNKYNV